MAATAEAKRLTEAHRLAQARIGAQTVRDLVAVFPLLDPDNLDASTPRWVRASSGIVRQRQATSATLAANYLTAYRSFELPDARPFVPTLAETVTAEQVATSLVVTGPVALKQALARGVLVGQAFRTVQAASAAAGMRHALNGGRDTITQSVAKDKVALGWGRATSGRPCAFCALLASRGPVYKTKQSAVIAKDGDKYHDSCHCVPEPVYHRDADWAPGARDYQRLWETSTQGFAGKDAINAFRRAFERPIP